ncbi:MAG: helix-turn-helix domain-containing protein [bacterium]|nr:helix-turn-helix domain-containing protein [bacterium]
MTQDTALTIMKTGANVFLTGEPGSGKTHTVNAYIRYLREHDIEPSITASTGIAATHVGGMTIHSWGGIGIRKTVTEYDLDALAAIEPLVRRMMRAKVLIIDEISMLGGDILGMVERVTRALRQKEEPFGGLQVIFVGDFFQLPPIPERGQPAQFCFNSPAWASANPLVCYLSEQHRQEDTAFLSTLTAIRRGELEDSVFEYLGERHVLRGAHPTDIPELHTHNVDVDTKNRAELEKITGDEKTFLMETKGSTSRVAQLIKGCLSPEELVLKIGAAVMFTKNNFETGYVNGTLGTVTGWGKDTGYPMVTTKEGDVFTAVPSEWSVSDNGKVLATITQIPLRLAWAITVHKSQGMSLDAAVMDLSRAFEYGQGYVALSRVRTFSGLHILGINQRAFEVHPLVLANDQTFREHSKEAEHAFVIMPKEQLATLHQNFVIAMGGKLKKKTQAEMQKKKGADAGTYDETFVLVGEGKTLREIAKLRGRTEGTIVEHLEKLALLGKLPLLDAEHFGGIDKRACEAIRTAIKKVGSEYLKPIFIELGERYPYEIIRLVRLEFGPPAKRDGKETKRGNVGAGTTLREKPAKLGAKWDKHEEEHLTKMFKSGMKTKDIANKLARLPGSIRARLKKLGLINGD